MNDDKIWEPSGTDGVFFVFAPPRHFLGYGITGCDKIFPTIAAAQAWLNKPQEDQNRDSLPPDGQPTTPKPRRIH